MNFGKIFNYPPAKKTDEKSEVKKAEGISSIGSLDDASFDVFLSKVQNGEFSATELKQMGFSVSDFKKEWIKSGEVSEFDRESAEAFNANVSEEAEAKGSVMSIMRKAWESRTLRTLFAIAVFTGKFSPAHGSTHTVQDANQNHMETSIKSSNDGNDGNYDTSSHFAKIKKGGHDNISMAGLKFKEAPIQNFSDEEAQKINHDYENFVKTLKFDKYGDITENPITKTVDSDSKKIEDIKNSLHNDFEKITSSELKAVSVLDVTNSFKIDNASITGNDLAKIISEIDNMLSKINHDNVKSFLEKEKIVSASSSPEATKYKAADKNAAPTLENNKQLSLDRANEFIKIYKSAVDSYDFSKSGLSAEEIEQVKHAEVKVDIPEKGYKSISELSDINPNTGEKYTDKEAEELKKTNYEEYMKLSDKCREVKANFMVDNKVVTEKVAEKISPMEAHKSPWSIDRTYQIHEKLVDLMAKYDHVVHAADDSETMKESKEEIAKIMVKFGGDTEKDSNRDIKMYSFSDKIGVMKQLHSFKEAGEAMNNLQTTGGSFERSAYAGHQAFEDSKIGEEKGSKLMLISTDEAIKATYEDVKQLYEEAHAKGVDVYYVLENVNKSQYFEAAVVSLDVIKVEFDKIYNKIASDAIKLINSNEKVLKSNYPKGYFKHGVIEESQKETLAKKSEVLNLSETMLRLSRFDVKADNGEVKGILMSDYL